MRLPAARLAAIFAIGAAGALVGDAGHVESGTGAYLSDAFPFVWESALWFPFLVGFGTVAVALTRLRLGPPAQRLSWEDGIFGIAAMIGLYALTAILYGEPLLPATVLCYCLAVLICVRLSGGRAALVCALAAALAGTLAEIALVEVEAFAYAGDIDTLAGVPPWLPALYLAFGYVASRLGELLAVPARA